MLYFAYGSNMNWLQMQDRCPSACFLCRAVLPDYKLAFTRKSIKRGCGVADVVPARYHNAWGVVYKISNLDVENLDRSEGYRSGRERNSYWRRECLVLLEGDEHRPQRVFTYFGDPQSKPPGPNAEYKELILSGARYWHLPDDYIYELEQAPGVVMAQIARKLAQHAFPLVNGFLSRSFFRSPTSYQLVEFDRLSAGDCPARPASDPGARSPNRFGTRLSACVTLKRETGALDRRCDGFSKLRPAILVEHKSTDAR